MRFERINVVGTSGSGKTSFARRLAQALGLPCYEMDAVSWQSGWRELPDEEFFPRIEEITRQPRLCSDAEARRFLEAA